ncbi:hypothetical protein [Stenotrophomonas maltophilia]|uniref:hypothetical protein n=1 Tax=Stenotrophomonas maltophilia TaxID=40324 RepID=UPI0039C0AE63
MTHQSKNCCSTQTCETSGGGSAIAGGMVLAMGGVIFFMFLFPFGVLGTFDHMGAKLRGKLVNRETCAELVSANQYRGQAIAEVLVNGYPVRSNALSVDHACFTAPGDPEGFTVRYELADGSSARP